MKELKKEVEEIARLAGSFIRKEWNNFDRNKVDQKKGFSDLVSYVDKEAERIIVERLSALDEEIGFIAEEGSGEKQEGRNWIVDPLDGTTNFIHGLPIFSVSIALADGSEPLLGVVYDVIHDEMFSAEKGQGAYLNDQKITVSSASSLEETLVATGFPYYEFEGLENYMKIMSSFMQSTRGLRRMGSAAIDLVYVACGRFDAFFEFNLNSYDVAGGALIVREAGGLVTTFNGEGDFLFAREIVASAPGVQKEVLGKIEEWWEK